MRQIKFVVLLVFLLEIPAFAQPSQTFSSGQRLENIRMRDVCILADEKTKTYYAISSGRAQTKEGFRNSMVRAFTS